MNILLQKDTYLGKKKRKKTKINNFTSTLKVKFATNQTSNLKQN